MPQTTSGKLQFKTCLSPNQRITTKSSYPLGWEEQESTARCFFVGQICFVMLRTMLNKTMKHFIYKTTHINGKYYIGRHSTENINDGYIGSGLWPSSIKDKSTLTREILEYAGSAEQVKRLEGQYLAEHYGKPGCMNRTADPIGFDSDSNPMKDPTIVAKIAGDNHWTKTNFESVDILRQKQNKLVQDGKHNLQGDSNPNKDGRNAKKAMANGTHVNLTNNPSIWRSEAGIHHWQNGNSPNAGGKLNKRLVAAGTHNLLGPEHNAKRINAGTHNLLGPSSNLDRLAAGTHPSQMMKTCEHCGKTASVSMYTRWHADRCKQNPFKETQ